MGGGGHSLLHDVEQNAKKSVESGDRTDLPAGLRAIGLRPGQVLCYSANADTALVASAVWGVSTYNTKRAAEQAAIAGAPRM